MLTLLMLSLVGEPASLSNVDLTPSRCDSGVLRAEFPSQRRLGTIQTSGLLDRSVQPQEVRRYLLLDRRDENNCPLPISFPVSGQPRALGRELGRESRPLSRVPPPPAVPAD
jgi:hypothetical protein